MNPLVPRVETPEPNPHLELRTFTTLQGRQPRWRRKYCRACNSTGEWRDTLLLALADIKSHSHRNLRDE